MLSLTDYVDYYYKVQKNAEYVVEYAIENERQPLYTF